MQGEGFEPSNSERTVLQTARFDRLHIPAKDSQGTYVGRDPSFLMIQEVNFRFSAPTRRITVRSMVTAAVGVGPLGWKLEYVRRFRACPYSLANLRRLSSNLFKSVLTSAPGRIRTLDLAGRNRLL